MPFLELLNSSSWLFFANDWFSFPTLDISHDVLVCLLLFFVFGSFFPQLKFKELLFLLCNGLILFPLLPRNLKSLLCLFHSLLKFLNALWSYHLLILLRLSESFYIILVLFLKNFMLLSQVCKLFFTLNQIFLDLRARVFPLKLFLFILGLKLTVFTLPLIQLLSLSI